MKYYRNFPDFVTFKLSDDFRQIRNEAVKGHFYPFEDLGKGLDPEDPT